MGLHGCAFSGILGSHARAVGIVHLWWVRSCGYGSTNLGLFGHLRFVFVPMGGRFLSFYGCLFAFKQTAIPFLCKMATFPEAHGVKCIFACQNTKTDWQSNVHTVVEWFRQHHMHSRSHVLLGLHQM